MAKKAKSKTQKTEVLTPEMIGEIAAEIAFSPIDDAHKAMFLYTIAQGTFNLKLYARYQELLKEYREELLEEAKRLEEEYNRIKEEYDKTTEDLSEAAIGALDEIEAYGQHIEDRAIGEIERRKGVKEEGKIEDIRKKLKKKK